MHRQSRPSFTLGIEEEYLLVDAQTMQLAEAPAEMMAALGEELGDNVSPEFLRCQVEIGTPRCADVAEARAQLRRLRGAVAAAAEAHGLAPIAASTHPMADWRDQKVTDKDRYATHARMMQAVAERILVSGMHVHVGLDDDDLRIDLMPQLAYFVPHLLALTTSSPFWRGADTGLASYRVSVFDGLPRTGLPGRFGSWSEYRRTVALLVESHEIEDASFIWWDVRPAERFPTLELRIMDVCPRLDDALAVTALIQALVRMLWRLKTSNMRWRTYDDFLVQENRWRAQRYGVREGLFDFGRGTLVPFTDLVEELIGLVAEDAEALGSSAEIARLRDIVKLGTGADRQRAAYAAALEIDPSEEAALTAVTRLLAEDFLRTG